MNFRKIRSNLLDFLILIFVFAGILSIVIFLLGERSPDYSVSSDKFMPFIDKYQPIIIDLRESNEVSQLPLSYQPLVHYPFLDLQKDMLQLKIDSTQVYLLICTDGNRSRFVASYFSSKGIALHYLRDGLWGVPEEQLSQLRDRQESD